MITRRVQLQLLVFGLIAAIGMTYTGAKYAGLGRLVTDDGYLVSAVFPDSGGIFQGAQVTNRGVTSGTVERLELVPEGVKVHLRLKEDTTVPADVRAVVQNRSAVGEQFVDLLPQRDGGPFLQDGAVIPIDRTAIPISPTEFLVNLNRLTNSVDTRQLGIVLDELGAAFENGNQSLSRLIDAQDTLARASLEAMPETNKLITDGVIVLRTQRETGSQFRSFNKDLALLADQLRSSDPDFRRLNTTGTQFAGEVTEFLDVNRSTLPTLFANLTTFARVQRVHLPAIRQILVTLPGNVAGGFTVAPGDGTTHFGLVTQGEPPVCTRGYESTNKREPENFEKLGEPAKQPNMRALCTLPRGSKSTVRGSQNMPRPKGVPNFPNYEGSDQFKNGTTDGGGANPSSSSEGDAPQAAPASVTDSGDTVVMGDYNPRTGNTITSDGRRYSIRDTDAPAEAFGNDAWKWLLLGPVTG